MTTEKSPPPSPCPYCASSGRFLFHGKDWNRKVSDAVFDLFECTGCGLLFLANPPEDLGRYYAQDMYFKVPETLAQIDAELGPFQERIDILTRYKKGGGDLLEIGPSAGHFCRLAQKAGFRVSAIEMDPHAAAFLSKELGVRTIESDAPWDVLKEDETRYDAICLWHAIEHLPRPWETIERAAERLKPGGILIVSAPNPKGFQAWTMGERWPHHDLPRHLFGISLPWLETLTQKNGLETLLKTTKAQEGRTANRIGWGMLLESYDWSPKLAWRCAKLLSVLLFPVENREGQGAAYIGVFRKP